MDAEALRRASLDALRRATLDGVPGAREMLGRRLRERVSRTVARRVEGADADDVTQKVVMIALRKLETFECDETIPNGFTRWVMRIATLECLQHGRVRQRRGRIGELDEEMFVASTGPLTWASRRERARLLRIAIEKLPSISRRAALSQLGGQGPRTFARIEGIPVATSATRRHRARRLLRRLFEELCGEVATPTPTP